MSGTASRIFGLDIMRFIAIILVLISHAKVFAVSLISEDVSKLMLLCGAIGVELFFVLSGYLIGGILIKTYNKEYSLSALKTFWTRRWFRTLPNYYLFVIINVVLALLPLLLDGKNTLNFGKLIYYPFFLQNFTFGNIEFFSESWSLCIEEWFYLTYPVAVYFSKSIFKITIKQAFLLSTILFIAGPIALRAYFGIVKGFEFDVVRKIVIARLDGIMIGVFVAYIKYYHSKLFYKNLVPAGLIGLAISAYAISFGFWGNLESVYGKIFYMSILSVGFGMFLPYLSEHRTVNRTALHSSVENISLWSYSLYLVNVPVRFLLLSAYKALNGNSVVVLLLLGVLFFTISILLSSFLFRNVEQYFLKIRDKAADKNVVSILS